MSWSLPLRSILAPVMLSAALADSAADTAGYAARVAPLIDPAKLATLGERAANPRVQKYVAHLAEAKKSGVEASNVVVQAVALVSMKGEAASGSAARKLQTGESGIGASVRVEGCSPKGARRPAVGQTLAEFGLKGRGPQRCWVMFSRTLSAIAR